MDEPRVLTTRSAFAETAHEAPRAARVPVEVRVAVDDPFVAYRRARGSSDDGNGIASGEGEPTDRRSAKRTDGVYLETTGGQAGWGYFATDPIFRLQVGDALESVGDAAPSPSLAELAGLLDRETLVRGDCDVPYPCGAFG